MSVVTSVDTASEGTHLEVSADVSDRRTTQNRITIVMIFVQSTFAMFDAIAHTIQDQVLNLHGVQVSLRRLDLVHPQISGNKFFKLKYNFLEAQQQGYRKIFDLWWRLFQPY